VTRTAKYKALYLTIRIGVPLIVLGVTILIDRFWSLSPAVPLVLVGLAIVMLRPGLMRRFLWRDLFAGYRLLKLEDYAASKLRSERLIARMRKAPWLKNLTSLGTTSLSGDPEALALSYLVAAEFKLGAFEAARKHLGESIALDPENPLLFRNMGVACLLTDHWADAKLWLEKAAALGLRDEWSDKIIGAPQSQSVLTDGGVSGDALSATGAWRVEVLNDDLTPMEFVVELLERIFDHVGAEAVHIMLTVHYKGSAVFGRYDEAEARDRVNRAIASARAANFPLSLRVAIDTPV
jgi:ATP-dependent Clp protease adaptor protein ClpS